MKVLYISPKGLKTDHFYDPGNEHPFDMQTISDSIRKGIIDEISDVDVTIIRDLLLEDDRVHEDDLSDYDLYLCDLTTSNANVTYFSGYVEGLGKPIIYFASSKSSVPLSLVHRIILRYSDASLDEEFKKELNGLIHLAKNEPANFLSRPTEFLPQPKAFISYSHKDKPYFDRLMVHLKPLMKKGLIDIWADTRIKTGDQWQDEIEKALSESSISIILVSADFMASDFIVENELQPLLSKAEVQGTKILPVIISPCRFSREPTLNRFQSANSPSEPLSSIDENKREVIYDQLASDIERTLNNA